MYEGIKILNGGQEVNLENLQLSVDGEHILYGVSTLKVFLDGTASYNDNVEIMENNSDVRISLTDDSGNEILIILKGLGDILLTNNPDLPIFEVFQGTEKLASMATIDDLDAAAAGGNLTSDQTGNPDGAGALGGTDSGDLAGRIDTFGLRGALVPPEGNSQPSVFDVDIEVDEIKGEEGAGDKNIYNGQLLVTDPDPEDAGLHTFAFVAGTLVVTSSSGVITLEDDDIELIVRPDGSFTLSGDFNDLAFGENATVSFDYTATDSSGATSDPATVTFTVNGTNDIPVVENIGSNVEGEVVDLYDDGSYVVAWTEYNQIVQPVGDFRKVDESSELNIYAQRYDSNGNKVGVEILVETLDMYNSSFYDDTFSVIALNDGGFTVNWRTEDYDKEDGGYGLHYQRYDSDDNISHPKVTIDESQEEGHQRMSKGQFAELNDGSIAMVWKEYIDNDDYDSQLLVQRVDIDGNLIGVPKIVAQEGYFDDLEVSEIKRFEIEPNGDSGFKIVWFQYVEDNSKSSVDESSSEVFDTEYYQLNFLEFDNDGNQVGDVIEVSRSNNWFNNPELTSLLGESEGKEIVTWKGYDEDDNNYGFYAQLVSSSSLDGEPIQLLDTENREIGGTPDIAALTGGGFVLTWNEYNYEEQSKDQDSQWIVYTQIFNALGEAVSEPIVVYNEYVDMGTAVHYDPSVFDVRGTESGGFSIAWFNNDSDGGGEKSFKGPGGYDSNEDMGFFYFSFDSEGNLIDSRVPIHDYEEKDGDNIITGVLTVSDDDETDTHTFEQFGDINVINYKSDYYAEYRYDSLSVDDLPIPEVSVTMQLNPETGEWEYQIEGDFNYLAVGEKATITFQYRAIDDANDPDDPFIGDDLNESSYSNPKTITVTIIGTNDQPIVEHVVNYDEDGKIFETSVNNTNDNETINTISGTLKLQDNDDDINDTHKFFISRWIGEDFDPEYDYNDGKNLDFQYLDGRGLLHRPRGEVEVAVESEDIDASRIEITALRLIDNNRDGDDQTDFEIDGDFSHLGKGETAQITFQFHAHDNNGISYGEDAIHELSRSEDSYVTITITGTNDQPVVDNITIGVKDKIYEDDLKDKRDGEDNLFKGQLSEVRDDDDNNTDPHYKLVGDVEVSKNEIGMTATDVEVFLPDANNNGWSTTRDYKVFSDQFNHLSDGETVTVTFYYKASDWEGFGVDGDENNEASHSEVKKVEITITGTNDQPVVDNITIGKTPNDIIYESELDEIRENEDFRFQGRVTKARDEDDNNTNPHYKILGDVIIEENTSNIDFENIQVFLKNEGNNGWSTSRKYNLTSDEFDNLAEGESVTISFNYKASDWEGFKTTGDEHNEPSHSEIKTVTIKITGTNDQPVIEKVLRDISEEDLGANLIQGQLEASDDDFKNVDNNEITFDLVDFNDQTPSNDEVVYSVNGNNFKLVSDDVNVNKFTNKITNLQVNSNGSYTVEGDFSKLKTDEEITLIFQYQANDNEGISSGDPIHEQSLSNIKTVELTIVGTNDKPVLKNIDTDESIDFTENDSKMIIDGSINIKDVDDRKMDGATVSIGLDAYEKGLDFLDIEAQYLFNGVTATFNVDTGVLTFEGRSSKSNYEDMLEKVTFVNKSDDPSYDPRTITWIVNDGEHDSDPRTTTINVIPVNDAPVAFKNFNEVVEKGVGVEASNNLEGNVIDQPDKNNRVDYDVDNPEDLVISGINSHNRDSNFDTTFNHTLNGEPALRIKGEYGVLLIDKDGNYEYNLKDGWNSTDALKDGEVVRDKFNYNLSDGDKADTSKLIIKITGTNDAPKAENDTYTDAVDDALTTREDMPLVITASMLLDNDEDKEGDSLEITDVDLNNPLDGDVYVNDDGNVVFTPAPNFKGDATFEYTVSDGNGGTDTAIVTVNVIPDADAPLLDMSIYDVSTSSQVDFISSNIILNNGSNKSERIGGFDLTTSVDLTIKSYKSTTAPGNSNSADDGYVKFHYVDGTKSGKISLENFLPVGLNNSEVTITLTHPTEFNKVTIYNDYSNSGNNSFKLKNLFADTTTLYEYEINLHGVLSDNSEILSAVTITGIPSGAILTDSNNNTVNEGDTVSLNPSSGDVILTLTSSNEINQSDLDGITAQITSSEMDGTTVLDTAVIEAVHNMLSLSGDDANLDFNNVNDSDLPELESIDLIVGSGNHILSNINADDVFSMTSDNELLINGDNGDTIKLDLATDVTLTDGDWFRDASKDGIGEDAYIGKTAGGTAVTLLIVDGIVVEDIS